MGNLVIILHLHTMKRFLFVFLISGIAPSGFLTCGSSNKTKGSSRDSFLISGRTTWTASYCGGAAPDEEMLTELATPKPLSSTKLFIIEGDTNVRGRKIMMEVISDSAGKFSFKLKPGKYSIIRATQVDPPDAKKYQSEYVNVNADCLDKWWSRPFLKLIVKDADVTLPDLNFHRPCFLPADIPCLDYTGPMPP